MVPLRHTKTRWKELRYSSSVTQGLFQLRGWGQCVQQMDGGTLALPLFSALVSVGCILIGVHQTIWTRNLNAPHWECFVGQSSRSISITLLSLTFLTSPTISRNQTQSWNYNPQCDRSSVSLAFKHLASIHWQNILVIMPGLMLSLSKIVPQPVQLSVELPPLQVEWLWNHLAVPQWAQRYTTSVSLGLYQRREQHY